jgi:hypothetical protein
MKIYNQIQGLLFLLPVLVVINVSCADDTVLSAQSTALYAEEEVGKILGKVTFGPLSPVEIVDAPSASKPAEGVKVLIINLQGQEIENAATDTMGHYSINLPAGSYRIDVEFLDDAMFSKDVPATVIIKKGQETRLDIHLDTGIR